MSNKIFMTLIAVLIVGVFGYVVIQKKDVPPESPRPGTEQSDKGQKHVEDNAVAYGGPEAPTSGDHSSPLPWQVYDQEIPDINIIHNMEHGGVYISYQPDLPADQIAKIKELFSKPYSNVKFTPNKAVVAPRDANDSPIIMSSWRRSMRLGSFDEAKMIDYYLRNVGKSPEPTAS